MTLFVVFDVESVGLHGEGFAVGAVLVDQAGTELASFYALCPPESAGGGTDGLEWVRANVPNIENPTHGYPAAMRSDFWHWWKNIEAREPGSDTLYLCADVAWPVEARFLTACVDDGNMGDRHWAGPYPLIDIASVRLAAGLDPLGTEPRLKRELPQHDPLADARQSARLLIEALTMVGMALDSHEAMHAG